jgi:hypothetical protein
MNGDPLIIGKTNEGSDGTKLGTSNIRFSYRVAAKRRDVRARRLAKLKIRVPARPGKLRRPPDGDQGRRRSKKTRSV